MLNFQWVWCFNGDVLVEVSLSGGESWKGWTSGKGGVGGGRGARTRTILHNLVALRELGWFCWTFQWWTGEQSKGGDGVRVPELWKQLRQWEEWIGLPIEIARRLVHRLWVESRITKRMVNSEMNFLYVMTRGQWKKRSLKSRRTLLTFDHANRLSYFWLRKIASACILRGRKRRARKKTRQVVCSVDKIDAFLLRIPVAALGSCWTGVTSRQRQRKRERERERQRKRERKRQRKGKEVQAECEPKKARLRKK